MHQHTHAQARMAYLLFSGCISSTRLVSLKEESTLSTVSRLLVVTSLLLARACQLLGRSNTLRNVSVYETLRLL